MNYNINNNAHIHYLGNELVFKLNNNLFLLNMYQSIIIEGINKYHNLRDVTKILQNYTVNSSYQKLYELVSKTVSGMEEREWINKSDKIISNNESGKKGEFYPSKLTIELTNKCHLSCQHCFKECGPIKRDFIQIKNLLAFLKKVQPFVHEIQLTGGEPMLHPQFKKISKFVNQHFPYTTLTTTGAFINEKNISEISQFNYIQISLYSNDGEVHDKITGRKGAFNQTIRGIHHLANSRVVFSVSSIIRHSLLDNISEYIKYLVELGVPEVKFGQLSILGRAKKINSDWKFDIASLTAFENKLKELKEAFKEDIIIDLWSKSHANPFLYDSSGKFLSCGAGLLEWNVNEFGAIKPCSFFPDYLFSDITIKNFEEYLYSNQSESIILKIADWENDLNSINMSTKTICEEIYKMVECKYEE